MSNNTKMRLERPWNELKALGACFRNTAVPVWWPRVLYSAGVVC